MAAQLAEVLAQENLDHQYLKEVFRHTRALLELGSPPTPQPTHELLAPQEAHRVYLAVQGAGQPRHRTMLRLQMLTALRTHELVVLLVEDVDVENLCIRVRASKRWPERSVIVPGLLREELVSAYQQAQFADEPYLFLSRHRRPYQARYIRRLFQQAGRRAGLGKRVTAQVMRLQLLVYLVEEGVVGESLLEMARTDQARTERTIRRLAESERRAAAERAAVRVAGQASSSVVPHPER